QKPYEGMDADPSPQAPGSQLGERRRIGGRLEDTIEATAAPLRCLRPPRRETCVLLLRKMLAFERLGPVLPAIHLPEVDDPRPAVGAAPDFPRADEPRDTRLPRMPRAFADRVEIRLLSGADDVDDFV